MGSCASAPKDNNYKKANQLKPSPYHSHVSFKPNMEQQRTEVIATGFCNEIKNYNIIIPKDVALLICSYIIDVFQWVLDKEDLDKETWESSVFEVKGIKFKVSISAIENYKYVQFALKPLDTKNNIKLKNNPIMYYELYCKQTRSEWKDTCSDLTSASIQKWNKHSMLVSEYQNYDLFSFSCHINIIGYSQRSIWL